MSEFFNAVHDGRGRWHLETSHAQHHRALFALPARTRSAGSSVHLHQVVPRCVGLINKLLQCSNSSPNRLAGALGWDLVRRFPMSAGSVCTSRGQICTTSSLRGAGDSTRDNSRLALQAFEFAVYDAIKIPGYSSAPARRFGEEFSFHAQMLIHFRTFVCLQTIQVGPLHSCTGGPRLMVKKPSVNLVHSDANARVSMYALAHARQTLVASIR